MGEIDKPVISKVAVDGVAVNSIGFVKSYGGKHIMVYFVGKNKLLRLSKKHIQAIDLSKTGKGYAYKICNICHILKPTSDFDPNQTDKKGRTTTRPSCKVCRQKIDGAHLLKSEADRLNAIRPLDNTVFTCPICQKRTIVGVTANIVKDHDHTTGMGREWICDSCNTGLGRFKDNIRFMHRVVAYLMKHNNSSDEKDA